MLSFVQPSEMGIIRIMFSSSYISACQSLIIVYFMSFQCVIFHIEYHPDYAWFAQCVTFNFFPTAAHELAYNLFNIITVYGLPLIVIIISYTIILCEITKKSRESKGKYSNEIIINNSNDYEHKLILI